MAIDPLSAGRKGQWDLERQQLADGFGDGME